MIYSDTIATLLISCPDKPGIVSAITTFLTNHGANITNLDQHSTDCENGIFFIRIEFQTPHLDVSKDILSNLFEQTVAKPYSMKWSLNYSSDRKKIAIFVSKYDHVLLELLWRASKNELFGQIVMVISNHETLQASIESFGIPFHHIPIIPNKKEKAEKEILKILDSNSE